MLLTKTPLLILIPATMLVLAAGAWSQMSEESEGALRGPETSKARYVGVIGCKCHAKEALGNQYRRWIGSKHMRSYVTLAGPYGRMIMKKVGMSGYAQETEMCFRCHAPKPDTSRTEPTFKFEEGVQCETCHGPGSVHVARRMTMGGENPVDSGFEKVSTAICMECHKPKPSHEDLPAHLRHFDLEKAWKKIAHPVPE